MKNRKHLWLGGVGIVACAVCCSLPILGSLVEVTFLASLTIWLEPLALLLLGAGIVTFFVTSRRKPIASQACAIDGPCNPKNSNTRQDVAE